MTHDYDNEEVGFESHHDTQVHELQKQLADLKKEMAEARDLQVIQALQQEVKKSRQVISAAQKCRDIEKERAEITQGFQLASYMERCAIAYRGLCDAVNRFEKQ